MHKLLPFILVSLCFGQGTTLTSGNILSAGERAITSQKTFGDSLIITNGDTTWLIYHGDWVDDAEYDEPVEALEPSATEFGSIFPDATHCYKEEARSYWLQTNESKLYYKLTEDEFTLIGVGDPGLGAFRLDNPETIYRFPMQRGDTFSDTSYYDSGTGSRYVYKTLNVEWAGRMIIKNIGLGINHKILEDSNTLKIKLHYFVIDTLINHQFFGDTVITRTGNYNIWIGSTSKYPYAVGGLGKDGDGYFVYLPESYTQTASPKSAELNWRVAQKSLTLSQQLQKDRQLTIHDLSGRTVYTQNLAAGTAVVQMSYDLSPGIYVLQVEGLGAQKGFVLHH